MIEEIGYSLAQIAAYIMLYIGVFYFLSVISKVGLTLEAIQNNSETIVRALIIMGSCAAIGFLITYYAEWEYLWL